MLFVVAIIFYAVGLWGLSAGEMLDGATYGFLLIATIALGAAFYTVERRAPRCRLPDTHEQRRASNLLR